MLNRTKERITAKKAELSQKQESFKILVESEINTSNFERNAINDLMVMMQLRSEIKELELQAQLLEVYR